MFIVNGLKLILVFITKIMIIFTNNLLFKISYIKQLQSFNNFSLTLIIHQIKFCLETFLVKNVN